MKNTPQKTPKKNTKKVIGMPTRTNIKVGSSIGDFWKKLKGLYPG